MIEMEKSIFLAASPVSWGTEGDNTPDHNTNEDDAEDDIGTLSKKHYKEYDLWGM